MQYTKKPLSYDEQADLLLERGLQADRSDLITQLSSVSYYRLSGYWYPFLRNDNTFGVADRVLESWLTALNGVRNVCAHHARLWNRVLGYKPMIPKKKKHPEWHEPVKVDPARIFGESTILKYILTQVAPQSEWPDRLEALFAEYPDIPKRFMGFPDDWKECPIWQDVRAR